jgi:hypothetical protein
MRHNTLAPTLIMIEAYFRWTSHVARDYHPQTHTTTMPQTTREEVEITALIRGILDGYPAKAIPREYIQNSDDAKASKQASFLGLRATSVFIPLIDFCSKGLHTRRKDPPFRKYLGSFAERGPRPGFDCL